MYHVPTKNPSKAKISKFHRKRERFWCESGKARKMSSTKSNTQLIKIEQAICDSHFKEKLNEESIAVAKIKSDPNFFIRYTKKNCVSKTDIRHIKHTQLLVNEWLEIYSLFLDHFNSVFTSLITNMIVHSTVSYFSCQSLNPDECLLILRLLSKLSLIIFMNFLPPLLRDQMVFTLHYS